MGTLFLMTKVSDAAVRERERCGKEYLLLVYLGLRDTLCPHTTVGASKLVEKLRGILTIIFVLDDSHTRLALRHWHWSTAEDR